MSFPILAGRPAAKEGRKEGRGVGAHASAALGRVAARPVVGQLACAAVGRHARAARAALAPLLPPSGAGVRADCSDSADWPWRCEVKSHAPRSTVVRPVSVDGMPPRCGVMTLLAGWPLATLPGAACCELRGSASRRSLSLSLLLAMMFSQCVEVLMRCRRLPPAGTEAGPQAPACRRLNMRVAISPAGLWWRAGDISGISVSSAWSRFEEASCASRRRRSQACHACASSS